MRNITFWLMGLFGLLLALPAGAHINPELHNKPTSSNQNTSASVSFREDCTVPQRQLDQGVNRLTNGKSTTSGRVCVLVVTFSGTVTMENTSLHSWMLAS